jgi:hypothetical protein
MIIILTTFFESSERSRGTSTPRVTLSLVCHEDGVFVREARVRDWRTHSSFNAGVAKVAAARMEWVVQGNRRGKRTEGRERASEVADSGSANASAERGGRSGSARERRIERKRNTLDQMLMVMIIDDDDDDDDSAFPRRARVAYCKYKLVPTEHLRRREQGPEREDVRVNAAPDV